MRSGRFLPVEVAAAVLADHRRLGRLQLLDRLGPDRHPAAAADGRGVHAGDRDATACLQDLLVVGQQATRELARATIAVGTEAGQLRLDGLELPAHDGFVLLGLMLSISTSTAEYSVLFLTSHRRPSAFARLAVTTSRSFSLVRRSFRVVSALARTASSVFRASARAAWIASICLGRRAA